MMPNYKCAKDYNLYKYQEPERVHQFLMGLNSSQFGIVRLNIPSIESLLNFNKVYVMVLLEQRQQKAMKTKNNLEATVSMTFTTKKAR